MPGDPTCVPWQGKDLRVGTEDGKLDERPQRAYQTVVVSHSKAKKFPSALVSWEYRVKSGGRVDHRSANWEGLKDASFTRAH